jgi:CheY-like chemotaxis protein
VSASEQGVDLAYEADPPLPAKQHGDSGRIRQVVVNLVGNAIKFTERGEVVVTAKYGPDSMFHVIVQDTGIGVPPDKQEAIFEAFTQADGSTTRKYGGTGLGLSISAQIARMMGGSIAVQSQCGRGSRFHFSARLREVREHGVVSPRSRLVGVRAILLSSGNASGRFLENTLRRLGLEVASASGADDAMELLVAGGGAHGFQFLISDGDLPEQAGIRLCESARARMGRDRLAIVLVGGHPAPSWREHLETTPCLTKPVGETELREHLEAALPGAPGRAERSPNIENGAESRQLRILLAEDNKVNQLVSSALLEKAGHEVTVVADGHSALEVSKQMPFDVILMDVQMPGMGGLEAAARIREREGQSGVRIPIIALTAHAMAGDKERCLEAGMDQYLSKPLVWTDLERMLDAVCTAGVNGTRHGQ